MHDAVDWKIIDENPLLNVKTPKNSVKVNEFVPREVVDKLMKKANPVWQVILGLSRYGGLRTPSETLSLRWEDIDWEMSRMSIPEPKVEHHEGRGIRSCPIFPELRPILDEAFEIFGDKSEYVVAAPQYRAAANTAMGWKNSNLRTEMTRLLRRAGAMHRVAWALQNSKAIGQKCKKPSSQESGKLKVERSNGQDRIRTTYKSPGKNRGSKMRRRKIRRAPQNTPCAACCMRALRLSLGH